MPALRVVLVVSPLRMWSPMSAREGVAAYALLAAAAKVQTVESVGRPVNHLEGVPMSDLQVSDERMATVGTIEVRIRTDEYPSDEASFLCVERIDKLQALIDTLNAWGVSVDGNTYAGTGAISGQFTIGRHGAFFDLIVSTEAVDA